jgi:adenylate cyclase
MTRILVVDDEPDLELLIRQKFRQQIREQKYEFDFAHNGNHAFKKIKEFNNFDLILSDINMPEMDGLTLLSSVHESFPLIKTIMVSAYGDIDNIRVAMNRGAFDFVIKPVDFVDLETTMEKTISHINQLKQTVNAIKENNILKMYVDQSVLNHIVSSTFEDTFHENEMIQATVAFIDICEFTSLSERTTPDFVVNLLNDYFDLMVMEINKENGIIDKFMGDCVMAVFKGDFHLDRAIDACLKIRNKMKDLPTTEGFKPHVSIGINSGEMVYGNIGSINLKRMDFTVIGDTVNVAQRLQSAAGEDQILILEESYNQVKNSFNCNKFGELHVKNKKDVLVAYEVVE